MVYGYDIKVDGVLYKAGEEVKTSSPVKRTSEETEIPKKRNTSKQKKEEQ